MARLSFALAAVLALTGCQDTDAPEALPAAPAPAPSASGVIDGDVLLERFPEAVGPYTIGATSADRDGALGAEVSRATARYAEAGRGSGPSIAVEIIDMGSREMVENMGYLWAVGDAATASEAFDGHPAQVEGDGTQRKRLRVLVGERFLVEVAGENVAPDRVDETARAVDLDGLAALAAE